ncbi:hypothetical protein Tco_0922064 [Tanacetum coccineum]|uniref:Uncharacterized protein n=1 Tax=Tanacetum coccineum TaxID=301880 RepID=A0ABQ5CYA7_9ASTR
MIVFFNNVRNDRGFVVSGVVCEFTLVDGASLINKFIEERRPVDAAGSGATTSAIGAMTLGAGQLTFDGGLSNSSNSGETKDPNQFLKVVQTVLKEEGLARVLN